MKRILLNRKNLIIVFSLICVCVASPAFSSCILDAISMTAKADSLSKSRATRPQSYALYKKANECFEESKQWKELVKNKISIASNLAKDGNTSSITLFDDIFKLINQHLNGVDSLLALAYHKKGVAYFYLYDYKNAIKNYQKALLIRLKYLPAHHQDIINGYRNIGGCFYQILQLDSAKIYIRKAINLMDKNNEVDDKLKLSTIQGYGRILEKYGDTETAHIYYQQSLSLFKEKDFESLDYLQLINNLAYSHSLLGNYNQSINLLLPIVTVAPKQNLINEIANSCTNIGYAYRKNNEPHKAEQYFLRAIELYNKVNEGENNIATCYNHLGPFYNEQKRFSEAIGYLEKAKRLNSKNIGKLVRNYDNLGDSYLGLKKYEEALSFYNLSINPSIKDFTPNDKYTIPKISAASIINDKRELLVTLKSKAKILRILYNEKKDTRALAASYQAYQEIDKLIDLIRQSYLAEESKYSLSEETKSIYENAINLCYQLYQKGKDEKYLMQAFSYAEKSKAIVLLESLRKNRAFQNIPKNLVEQEKELDLSIRYYQQDDPENKLFELREKQEKLRKRFYTEYPTYFQSKYFTSLRDIKSIQENLRSDELFLEYVLGENQSYLFVLSKGEPSQMKTIPHSRESLKEQLGDFLSSIYGVKLGNKYTINGNNKFIDKKESDQQYAILGHQLYNTLIFPALIKFSSPKTKITIIPDDILNHLPFDALLSQPVPQEVYSKGRYQNQEYNYLVKDFEISYCYSATLLEEMSKPSNNNNKKEALLTFNSKEFANQINLIQDVYTKGRIFPFFLESQYEKSNKKELKSKLDQYKYLHLSVHGLVNEDNPDLSHLVLENIPGEKDSLLYLYELYNLPLDFDMVVTSACDVGIGQLKKGEGVLSMARGFAYAGTKSLVTTLWSVQGEATGIVLQSYYQNLKEEKDKRTSLTLAKRQFIDNNSEELAHPFYWAGIIPIGDIAPINTPYPYELIVIMILGIVLFLSVAFLFKKFF